MAKTAVFDSDTAAVAKAAELKKELTILVKIMVDGDDYSSDIIERVGDILCVLKNLKMIKRSTSLGLYEAATLCCPEEFKCPISKQLMRDPVIVSSGQTYDRAFIQKWLKAGNGTCPQTQQVLSHTIMIPNLLIREMISQWCKCKEIEYPNPSVDADEDNATATDRDHFFTLLEKMSSTLSDQKIAAKELRSLTKRFASFRVLFGESPDTIPKLLIPLSQSNSESRINLDLQENIITTLLNLSIHDENKKLVCETPSAILLLIEAVKSGTIETRSNAAAALFTLSALDSNKALIGKFGALKPLIDLLEEGHTLAMKDVASAIFNLCIFHENKARAVRDGAVHVLVIKIMDRTLVDELLPILAMISSHQKAIDEIGELGAVPCLLEIIRENSCQRNNENCIAILHTICLFDRTKWKVMRDEERVYGTISKLAQNGTSRAKRKANGILERLNRSVYITHTA